MNRTLSLKYLWWKEFRQLTPLLVVLLMVGALLQFIVATTTFAGAGVAEFAWRFITVGCALPGLFAVGAGALLVGQERELRTLQWLRSLPIAPRDILFTKLTAGFLGLASIWLLSLGITGLFLVATRATFASTDLQVLPFVVHSFFLLAVGYTTAWLIRSSFVSLVLVIPLALLPLLAMTLHDWFLMHPIGGVRPNSDILFAAYSLLFTAVFSLFAWRQGQKALGAEIVHRRVRENLSKQALAYQSVPTAAVAPVYPALLWQFVHQNLMVIVALGGLLMAAAGVAGLIQSSGGEYIPALPYSLAVAIITTSWLGQLVFHSDSVDRRHLFLATRGVSVWQVWSTRQLVPLALVGVFVSLVLLRGDSATVAIVVLPLFATYAASQFLCQFLRSPILAAIISPVFGSLCAIYCYSLVAPGLTPLWIAFSACFILLFATLLMGRSWIDGKSGWKEFAKYLAFLAAAAIVPLIPAFYTFATIPRLTATEYQRLQRLAAEAPTRLHAFQELPLAIDIQSLNEDTLEMQMQGEEGSTIEPSTALAVPPDVSQTIEANLFQTTLEQLRSTQQGVPHGSVLRSLIPEMLRRRLAAKQEQTQEQLANYRLAVSLALESAVRLRQTIRLDDQISADKLDIALLEELRQPDSQTLIGSELYEQVRNHVQDQSTRDQARRWAVASAWRSNQLAHSRSILDSLRYSLLEAHLDNQLTQRLLQLTDAPVTTDRGELQRIVRELQLLQPANKSSGSLYLLGRDQRPELLYTELDSYRVADWHGEWEKLASELVP